MLTVLVFFIKYFSSHPGQKSILSSYLGKNSMLSSYICRPKEYVILLCRPKEYFILLSRPKEYAQWSNGAWSSNTDHLYRKKRGNYRQNQNTLQSGSKTAPRIIILVDVDKPRSWCWCWLRATPKPSQTTKLFFLPYPFYTLSESEWNELRPHDSDSPFPLAWYMSVVVFFPQDKHSP